MDVFVFKFQNPFCKGVRGEKFGSSGRSLSAPDSYDFPPRRRPQQETVNLPSMTEGNQQEKRWSLAEDYDFLIHFVRCFRFGFRWLSEKELAIEECVRERERSTDRHKEIKFFFMYKPKQRGRNVDKNVKKPYCLPFKLYFICFTTMLTCLIVI